MALASDPTPTDWRTLCAELLDALECEPSVQSDDWPILRANARAALAQPEPQGAKPAPNYDRVPLIATEAQIRAAAQYLVKKQHCDGDLIPAIRYAVARWGRPVIEPVPQQEAE